MPPDIRGDYAKRWRLTGLQRLWPVAATERNHATPHQAVVGLSVGERCRSLIKGVEWGSL